MWNEIRLDIICAAVVVLALEPLGVLYNRWENWWHRRATARLHETRKELGL